MLDPTLQPERPAQVGPEAGLDHADGQPAAVGCLVGVVAGVAAGEDVAAGPGQRADGEVLVDLDRHEGEDPVGRRHVEVGPLAGGGPAHERGEDRDDRVHPAAGAVGNGRAGDGRLPAGAATGAVEEPADCEVVQVVAGPRRVGPVLAVAARGAVDDAGVHRAHVVVADAEPRHDARTEALDDDGGALGEAQEHLTAFGRLEVEQHPLHTALTAVGVEHRVDLHAFARWDCAHLHDGRAVVAQPTRRAGGRTDRRQVEDGDAFEERHVRSSSAARACDGR